MFLRNQLKANIPTNRIKIMQQVVLNNFYSNSMMLCILFYYSFTVTSTEGMVCPHTCSGSKMEENDGPVFIHLIKELSYSEIFFWVERTHFAIYIITKICNKVP